MKVDLEEIYYLINSVKFDNNLLFTSIENPTKQQAQTNITVLEVLEDILRRLEKTYPEYTGPKYNVGD